MINIKNGISFIVLALMIGLVGCSGSASKDKDTTVETNENGEQTIKIAASSVPHAEILEFISDDLEKDGITLDISIVSDGIQTNQATADGTIDANFFQHTPYLEQVNEDAGLDLVNVKGVHIEPFGLYSKTVDDIEDLEQGAQISIPKDPVNHSRALELLAANGVIKLDETVEEDYSLQDITENEKNFKFVPVDAEVLVHSLDDVDASTINTNYALEAGFVPLEDSLIIEGNESPFVNILVTRPEISDDEAIKKLSDALTTEKVRQFIEEQYEGAVVPAF